MLSAGPSALSVTSQPWEMHTPAAITSLQTPAPHVCCVARGSTAALFILNTLGGGCQGSCDSKIRSVALPSPAWVVVGVEAALMDPAPEQWGPRCSQCLSEWVVSWLCVPGTVLPHLQGV